MKKVHIECMIFFSFFFCSCSENNITEYNLEEGLNFYLLKDASITATQVYDSDIYGLKLTDSPFLTYKDIAYYNWAEHSFEIDSNKARTIQKFCAKNPTVFGIPFVVTVDQERIYVGAFWFLFSSVAPTFPYIDAKIDSIHTVLTINRSWDSTRQDLRNDKRIYNTLEKSGLLLKVKSRIIIERKYTLKQTVDTRRYIEGGHKKGKRSNISRT